METRVNKGRMGEMCVWGGQRSYEKKVHNDNRCLPFCCCHAPKLLW